MSDLGMPETRYAHSGDINIAYQTIGGHPLDIVIVPGSISHVEFHHELPGFTAFLHRLSRFARVVTKEGKACRIGCPVCRRWKNAWTMFAPSWMRSARSGLSWLVSPKAAP